MLQKIIDFFRSLFGGNKSKNKTTSTPKPSPKPSPRPSPKPGPKPIVNEPVKPPPVEKPKKKEPIHFTPPTATLYLGCHDSGVQHADIVKMLKVYHHNMSGVADSVKYKQFRHGDLFGWVSPKKLQGEPVAVLQKFLIEASFLPAGSKADGIFGYATQAATRLFQEYVRSVEGNASIGTPDGVIGNNGWKHIKRWTENHKTAEEWSRGKQSSEYTKWLGLLSKASSFYKSNAHPILDKVNDMVKQIGAGRVDTLEVANWESGSDQIHLIGIRRKEEDNKGLRKNDDLFILLIGGMVFKFWGSTDPNHKANSRADEAFLVEGQHKFRFGWHNRSVGNKAKVYQGLNPYSTGVLVFRDRDNDNKLTDKDIQKGGIDNAPNNTINIHWTGAGEGASGTWSAGCQVIAGKNYINHKGDLIDCSKFAAAGSKDLKNNRSAASLSKTKAAYNVFTDLILLYRPANVDYLYYTLGRDETFDHKFVVDLAGADMLTDTLKMFNLPGMS